MEKDYGKIEKNATTSVVIRVDDFGGKPGLTIREFVNGSDGGYSGFTKSGTRIPAEKFLEFREVINSIKLEDFKSDGTAPAGSNKPAKEKKADKAEDTPVEDY